VLRVTFSKIRIEHGAEGIELRNDGIRKPACLTGRQGNQEKKNRNDRIRKL